ncbi:hypothetical protein KQI63_09395 [bacterium]|nr:hypothetical protein [bacterium]
MKTIHLVISLLYIALLLFPQSACAQSYNSVHPRLWEPVLEGLRAEAMGGTRIATGEDVQSANGNPATLLHLSSTTLELAGRESSFEASRGLNHEEQLSGWQPRSLAIAHHTPLLGIPLTFAFGYQRPESRATVIDEENQDNSRQDGFFGGVGFEPVSGVWLGFSASHLLADFRREISLFQSGSWSEIVYEERMRATFFRIGILFDLSEGITPLPLQIGVSVRPPADMKLESNLSMSREVAEMPPVLSTGLAWAPFQRFRAAIDLDYFQISGRRIHGDVAHHLISMGNRDMACLRFGVEKVFPIPKGHLALRAGVRTFPTLEADYSDDVSSGSPLYGFGYTTGAGLRIGRAELNLAIVHLDRYKGVQQSPFGDPFGADFQGDYHAFSLGFSYHFQVVDPDKVVWKPKQPRKEAAMR